MDMHRSRNVTLVACLGSSTFRISWQLSTVSRGYSILLACLRSKRAHHCDIPSSICLPCPERQDVMELDLSDFLTIVNLSRGYTLSRKDMEEASLAQQLQCLTR